MSPRIRRPAPRDFPTQTAPGAAPQTSLPNIRDLILRVRRLEALPGNPRIVSAYWEGARGAGNPVASPTSDQGEPLAANQTFRTNSLETFGTGMSTDPADPPTNDPSDEYALILRPGIFIWTAEFQFLAPTSIAPPWPENTVPWVDHNVEESFREMWSLPNQSGFPTDWDLTGVGFVEPPVFTAGGAPGTTQPWQDNFLLRYSGHGVVTNDMLVSQWGFFQLLLRNQSGSDVGIDYSLSVSGVTSQSVAEVENVY